MELSLSEAFRKEFLRREEKTAISFIRDGLDETVLTYGDLETDSNKIAKTLLGLGIQKGDRVILLMPKSIAIIVFHIAIQKIGAHTVILNPDFNEFELSYLINDASPKLIILGTGHESAVKNVQPSVYRLVIDTTIPYKETSFFRSASDHAPEIETSPADAGVIIYTSGTTGKPKGVVMSQGKLLHDALNIIGVWKITEKDTFCHSLPLYHTHGLSFALHTALLAGSNIRMQDQFNPDQLIKLLKNKQGESACSVFMGVPTMYSKILEYIGQRKFDFSHMRLWTCGSAPLQPRDFWKIKEILGKEPVEREGMTETGMNFSNPIEGNRVPGSVGLSMPKLQVRIVDPETFKLKQRGEVGEIWLKGPGVTSGYWQKPEETRKTFKDGWFRTGDLAKVDQEGYYYLIDRIKNIIISGGENISPKEIELTLNQIDDVLDSSVVGITDCKWGERVVAAIVKKPGSAITSNQIISHCKKYLHKWKCPKDIVFVDSLPRNSMGKILRNSVKKLFE